MNFIDTAEGYSVTPVSADTQFLTETYIGNWIAGRKKRDDIILATKVSGPARDPIRTFRGGNNRSDLPGQLLASARYVAMSLSHRRTALTRRNSRSPMSTVGRS